MAAADSIMAPSRDSSAWRSWGGTRPAALRVGGGSVVSRRGDMGASPSSKRPVGYQRHNVGETLGISAFLLWTDLWTTVDEGAPDQGSRVVLTWWGTYEATTSTVIGNSTS